MVVSTGMLQGSGARRCIQYKASERVRVTHITERMPFRFISVFRMESGKSCSSSVQQYSLQSVTSTTDLRLSLRIDEERRGTGRLRRDDTSQFLGQCTSCR